MNKPAPILLHKPNPTDVGRKVLAGFAHGLAEINAERQELAAARRVLILQYAAEDDARGKPLRGRAGRIRQKLPHGGKVSVRRILKILSEQRAVVPIRCGSIGL